MSIWSGPDDEILNELRLQRLDRTTNDHELSQEVLAAHLNDKQDLLRQYIEAKLKKEEPAEIARAIMVAGFSDHCEFNVDVLNRYQDYRRFLLEMHITQHSTLMNATLGRDIGLRRCAKWMRPMNSGAFPFCSQRLLTEDTISGNQNTQKKMNRCSCSGLVSEAS